MSAELSDDVMSLLNNEDFVVCDSDYNLYEKDGKVERTSTIECVNFAMSDSTIGFKKIMSSLVYSPNARFAVNVETSAQKVTSMYILNPLNMQFHQYRNCNEKDIDMEVFYWYSEDCLVFINIDSKTANLHQTPVVLNHQTKTYEAREFVSYTVPSRISFKAASREAQTIELEGKKYVLLVSVTNNLQDVYAISQKPDSSIKLKKYLFHNAAPVEIANRIKRRIRGDITHMFLSTQISVINNNAYFPVRFHCKENNEIVCRKDISEMLGVYIKANFSDMPEVPSSADRNTIFDYIQSLNQSRHICLAGVAERILLLTKNSVEIRNTGMYRNLKNNLLFISEEKKSTANVSTISFINVHTRTVSTTKKIVHSRKSEVVVSPTPFNILIAKKMSQTQISCSTIPYPFNKKTFPTLQEMILSKTYLNMEGKQEFASTFTI